MKNKGVFGKRILCNCFLVILFAFSILNLKNVYSSFTNSSDENGIKERIKAFTKNYDKEFVFKSMFVNINGLVHTALDQTEMNNVYRMNNDYITVTQPKSDMLDRANKIADFNNYLKTKECPFIYIQAPDKISKYDPQMPIGINDYSNRNADQLLGHLVDGGVEALDLRKEIKNDKIDPYTLFFRTDHHWNIEGAFYAQTKIVEYLNNNLNFKLDTAMSNIENYEIDIIEDAMLGYEGKRVGYTYSGLDDLSLITPKFETSLELSVPSQELSREGEFSEAILNKDRLSNDYFNTYPYYVYIGTDDPSIIKNNMVDNNKKVLVIKDSFGLPVSAFLSLSVEELHIMDLRYNGKDSLRAYIEEMKPDVVVMLYSPSTFNNDEIFDFQ